MTWDGCLFLKEKGSSTYSFFNKIITGLAKVSFEGVLIKVYKGTRRNHNEKIQTNNYPDGHSFFPKTISAWNGLCSAEVPSFAEFK